MGSEYEDLQARLAVRSIFAPSTRPSRPTSTRHSRALRGRLAVQVIEATRLDQASLAFQPFVVVSVGSEQHSTKVGKAANPRWDEGPFTFYCDSSTPDKRTVNFEVLDQSSVSTRSLGKVQFSVRRLKPGQKFDFWMPLQTGYVAAPGGGAALKVALMVTHINITPDEANQAVPSTIIQFSGCKDDQTSADVANTASFGIGGRGAGGACTCSMIKAMQQQPDCSWVQLLRNMRRILKEDGYQQIPQLSCSRDMNLHNPIRYTNWSPKGSFRSVLIGINYYGSRAQLSGCHNDVFAMQKAIQQFGFKSEDQWVLLDDGQHDKPTYCNITRAMHWLVDGAKEGDSLFFHYSGHGTTLADDDYGEEDSGMDQALCPVDYEYSGMLRDDTVYEIMVSPLHQGANLVCVTDCCHSGSIMDLPYTFKASERALVAAESSQRSLEGAKMEVNQHFNVAMAKEANQRHLEHQQEAAHANSQFHRQLKAEVDDVLKVGLTKRLERMEQKVQTLLGNSSASRNLKAPSSSGAEKQESSASVSDSSVQTNEDVKIEPHKRMSEAFEKALIASAAAARTPNKRFGASRIQRRYTDPPEKDERIYKETATLSTTASVLNQQVSCRERQLASLRAQLEVARKLHEEQKASTEASKAAYDKMLSNSSGMEEVRDSRLAARKKRIAEFTKELEKTRTQGERNHELAQQQRLYIHQSDNVDRRGGKDVIKWHSAGEVFLVPRPPPLGDEKIETWDVGTAIANPYVVDSWPFEPNVMAKRTCQDPPMGVLGPMAGVKEETEEDLRAEQRRLPNLNLRLPQPGDDDDDEDFYGNYGGPSETSRSL
mmetsp:Transcript_108109/g.187617  ORF Transcript_108109/g.187617 Transcript_108109/m.187617 type:complete len:826 (-) Transcript_108109:84-2561(-)